MIETDNVKLVGDVKCSINDYDKSVEFLKNLEELMEFYKIDKVDVSWKKFINE